MDQGNPIQKECRVDEYYKIQAYYHSNRIQKNEEILNSIKEQARKSREQLLRTATITILLDSFAHNISAHSLTALSWWSRELYEYQSGEGREMLEALGATSIHSFDIINWLKARKLQSILPCIRRFPRTIPLVQIPA